MGKSGLRNKTTWQALTIGIEISLSITFGMGAGWWLDQKFDTEPIVMILGLLSGVGAAIKALVRLVKMDQNNPPE